MYIIDEDANKKIDSVIIILNKNEIQQLLGYAKQLLEEVPSSDHYHLSSDDYKKEITICMYNSESINQLHPEIQKLINENE